MITDSLRAAIEALHQAIADEPDPGHKQILAQCLQNMMRVQADAHSQVQQQQPAGGRRDALLAQMAGGVG